MRPRPRDHKQAPHTAAEDWQTRFNHLSRNVTDPRLKAFYRASCVPAHTPVKKVNFMALDLETTGLDLETDAILSIGYIPLKFNRICCSSARNIIIRPGESPEHPLAEIHGITHSHLKNAPEFDNILEDLLNAMAGHIILAHYNTIERGFLDRACRELLGQPLEFPVVDTMELEARIHTPFTPNTFQRWMGLSPSPSLRLSHSRERYGLPRYTPHHALTDALATAELFMAQVADRFSPETPVGELWI
ncbi:MAG: 3'-5' exonuclease [Desulfobacter sp.]|nr:MAG: 3'-5' exonuclease [Desulfobacter sp.]